MGEGPGKFFRGRLCVSGSPIRKWRTIEIWSGTGGPPGVAARGL